MEIKSITETGTLRIDRSLPSCVIVTLRNTAGTQLSHLFEQADFLRLIQRFIPHTHEPDFSSIKALGRLNDSGETWVTCKHCTAERLFVLVEQAGDEEFPEDWS